MDNSIITRLLENNTAHNNNRVMQTIFILLFLIVPVTLFMKLQGWTSPDMSITSILQVSLYSTMVLIVLYLILKRYGKHAWTKWLVMLAIWSIFLSFRSIAYHAGETHALMYLIIILSVFYFDYKLVLFATFLCMAGDYLLLALSRLHALGGSNPGPGHSLFELPLEWTGSRFRHPSDSPASTFINGA